MKTLRFLSLCSMTFESSHDFNWHHDTLWTVKFTHVWGWKPNWIGTADEKYTVFRLKIHPLKCTVLQNWTYWWHQCWRWMLDTLWFTSQDRILLKVPIPTYLKSNSLSPKLWISRLIILLFNIILWCVVFKWGCHLPAILCIFHFPTLACTLFPVLKDLPIVAPEWPLIREWDLKKKLSWF